MKTFLNERVISWTVQVWYMLDKVVAKYANVHTVPCIVADVTWSYITILTTKPDNDTNVQQCPTTIRSLPLYSRLTSQRNAILLYPVSSTTYRNRLTSNHTRHNYLHKSCLHRPQTMPAVNTLLFRWADWLHVCGIWWFGFLYYVNKICFPDLNNTLEFETKLSMIMLMTCYETLVIGMLRIDLNVK